MQELDGWIGDILDEVETLGIADNTVIIIMGDNGPMKQALGSSGFTDMVYRGYQGRDHRRWRARECILRWPEVIKAGSIAGDMIHVSDLYTTIARITGTSDLIPRDRIVDGVDQASLLINGDNHSRRDYLPYL